MVKVLIVLALGLLVQLTQACLLPEFPYGSMRTSRYEQRGRYQLGTIVWFQCSRGYELKGKSRLVCERSYKWDGDFPKCLKPCPHPNTFFGGKFEPDQAKYLYDDKVYYACPRSRGKYTYSTCQMNGKWEQASKCYDYCYVPDNMMYHHKPYGKKIYKQGEKIYYECKDDYYKQDKYEYEWATCMAGGKWNNMPYKCAKKCVAPKYMDYHHIAYAKKIYMDGEYIKYMCKDGYYKDHFKYGYDKAMCKYDGSWDKAPFKCMKKCKAPDHIDYYHMPYAKKMYLSGQYIKYVCKDGYYKDDSKYGYDKAMCKYDGSWDKAPFKCMKKCKAPKYMDYHHMPYAKKMYLSGEYIKYMCKDGYYKDDSKYGYDKALCKYDGSWDKAPYKCSKKCMAPKFMDYHHVAYAKKMYMAGEYIKYVCKYGYYKDDFKYGYDKAKCKYDGSWDSAPYKCIKYCEKPKIDYGMPVPEKNQYSYGSKVSYKCIDGYKLFFDGPWYQYSTCMKNGKFDFEPPTCKKEKKNCHAPSTFYYGYYSPQKSTFDYGEYITFYCYRGYQLNKRYQRVRCGVNGVWENILPTCSSDPY